jgi:hypothetical protein
LKELKDGPLAQPRLTAAEELHKLGRPEGLAAMIGWWKSVANSNASEKLADEDPAGWSHLIADFLVLCGELEAMHALAHELHTRPVDVRLHVISNLWRPPFGTRTPPKEPAKVAAEIERLLIASLDDPEERVGMSGSWGGKEFADPRICDMAGFVLNDLYPKKYSFDLAAELGTRNRQLLVMKNVWRSANKLPPLPEPEPQPPPSSKP